MKLWTIRQMTLIMLQDHDHQLNELVCRGIYLVPTGDVRHIKTAELDGVVRPSRGLLVAWRIAYPQDFPRWEHYINDDQ